MEKEALDAGVQVKFYSSNNGFYTSTDFINELDTKGQGVRLSGGEAHHHNGGSEASTKMVFYKALSMVTYASLCWTKSSKKYLWPLVISHTKERYYHFKG